MEEIRARQDRWVRRSEKQISNGERQQIKRRGNDTEVARSGKKVNANARRTGEVRVGEMEQNNSDGVKIK